MSVGSTTSAPKMASPASPPPKIKESDSSSRIVAVAFIALASIAAVFVFGIILSIPELVFPIAMVSLIVGFVALAVLSPDTRSHPYHFSSRSVYVSPPLYNVYEPYSLGSTPSIWSTLSLTPSYRSAPVHPTYTIPISAGGGRGGFMAVPTRR